MNASLSAAKFRSSYPLLGLVFAVSTGLISIVLFLHCGAKIPIATLTRDPTTVAQLPIYTGFLSQIGLFFWAASAAFCIVSAKILSKFQSSFKTQQFLVVSALLTLVLGLDDGFLLHEALFPHIGIPEKVVFTSYAGFLLFYLIRFYTFILKTEYILLAVSLFFFGISVVLDVLRVPSYLLEDGAKLIGIMSWMAYFFNTAICSIWHHMAQHPGTTPDSDSALPSSPL